MQRNDDDFDQLEDAFPINNQVARQPRPVRGRGRGRGRDVQEQVQEQRVRLVLNENGTVWLEGHTYEIRGLLAESRGIWDGDQKKWLMPVGFGQEQLNIILQRNQERIDAQLVVREGVDNDGNRVMMPPRLKLIQHCNAYKVKDQIKASGGYWDQDRKGWIVPVGFDESIIPSDDRPRDEEGNVIRRAPKCSFCGSEGHKKNTCPCNYCGMNGLHPPDKCPTQDPRYCSSGDPLCRCNCMGVCEKCLGAAE